MPACAKLYESSRILLLVAGLLLTHGCNQQSAEQRFEIRNIDLTWSNGLLDVSLSQSLVISNEAQEALKHGVPLTLQIELILRDTSNQTRAKEKLEDYEIRYLPLSELFQLTLPAGGEIRTFPRLRHLLADLSRLRITMRTGALPAGQYELMARTRIDKQKIPLSMRLPIMFHAEWKHNSHWSSWPLEISPAT